MIENCKTIVANMRRCVRNHQSANIGGGLFGPAEIGAAADKIDSACDLLVALESIIAAENHGRMITANEMDGYGQGCTLKHCAPKRISQPHEDRR